MNRVVPATWAAATAAAGAVAVVLLGRWGADWPAQEFRGWAAVHDTSVLWTNSWYSGMPMLGYSVLLPIVTRLVGTFAVAVLAATASCWFSVRLLDVGGRRGRAMTAAIVAGVLGNLVIGQVTFLLGCAFGTAAAYFAVRTERRIPAAVAAVLAGLGSPLCGAFLLLSMPALLVIRPWRRVLPLGGAVCGVLISAVTGGAVGVQPLGWPTVSRSAVFIALILLVTPRVYRVPRVLAAGLGLCLIASIVWPNAIGGNLERFGQLIAVPLALAGRPVRRRLLHHAVLLLALGWQILPVADAVSQGAHDPSRSQSYYTGLEGFLSRSSLGTGRVEIPFTADHWESFYVAERFAIARGWERQIDVSANAVLYHPLTAAAYRTWLVDNGVSYVALPDVPLDAGGTYEADVIGTDPDYLVPVWHDAHWRVWRVRTAGSLVDGPASVTALGTSSMTLQFARAGRAVVHVRSSSLWRTSVPGVCTGATADGWLWVQAPAAGTVPMTVGIGLGSAAAGC